MQAFVAYCMGLDKEDARQFNEAAKWYQQAVQLDPNFEIARQKLEMNKAVAMVQSSGDKFFTKADSKDNNHISANPVSDLVGNRLQNLSISIGSNFIPGQDSRKPLEESLETGANIGLGNLPEPPDPPIRK